MILDGLAKTFEFEGSTAHLALQPERLPWSFSGVLVESIFQCLYSVL